MFFGADGYIIFLWMTDYVRLAPTYAFRKCDTRQMRRTYFDLVKCCGIVSIFLKIVFGDSKTTNLVMGMEFACCQFWYNRSVFEYGC